MDRSPSPGGYSTRDVASLLGLSVAQIRSYARAGFVSPQLGPQGELLFTFQDLVLLRTAKALLAARIPRRRVRMALKNLHEQLPQGRPLTGVRISAHGHHVVARDGGDAWNPESGQTLLDFAVGELEREAAALHKRPVLVELDRTRRGRPVEASPAPAPEQASAADWYERGVELEAQAPAEAVAAYREALVHDPDLPDAHLNLGRLLHERGDLAEAELHYRLALATHPGDPLAAYNLGVVLQDQGHLTAAAAAYERALAADPALADAHFNLAGIYEALGQGAAAFGHLRTYRDLTEGKDED
ncbi:MAG TPA: tetratricopeptide repeat protein [Thermoanaerobaculia bacterium]|nr:tetratricopeptide repeat protein [Thermoanaerobaculia bacterium]